MTTLYKEIIAKVRDMYKYDSEYKEILKNRPEIKLKETKNGEFELNSIHFTDGYSSIYIGSKSIWFDPYRGENKTLVTYSNLEELLKI